MRWIGYLVVLSGGAAMGILLATVGGEAGTGSLAGWLAGAGFLGVAAGMAWSRGRPPRSPAALGGGLALAAVGIAATLAAPVDGPLPALGVPAAFLGTATAVAAVRGRRISEQAAP